MSSTRCACDTLMEKVSYADERLDSIQRELSELLMPIDTPSGESVLTQLRALRNELSSALREAQHAHTTEPQTCGQTKLNSILKDTLEAIEVSALLLVQSMKMIVMSEPTVENTGLKTVKSEADGGTSEIPYCRDTCTVCLRIADHLVRGKYCKPQSGGLQ